MSDTSEVESTLRIIHQGVRGLFLMVIVALVVLLLMQPDTEISAPSEGLSPEGLAFCGLLVSLHVAFMFRYISVALRKLQQQVEGLARGDS